MLGTVFGSLASIVLDLCRLRNHGFTEMLFMLTDQQQINKLGVAVALNFDKHAFAFAVGCNLQRLVDSTSSQPSYIQLVSRSPSKTLTYMIFN